MKRVSNYRFISSVLLVAFTLFVVILFNYGDIFARAGGGHNFGGDSHSTGGFGSYGGYSDGGGGDMGFILSLIMVMIKYPYLGIPIVGGGILFFYFMGKGANRYYTSSIIRRAGALSIQAIGLLKTQMLKRLKEMDPDFSEERFLKRVETAFMTIQKCWSEQNLNPMRHFVSNGLFSRFEIQIDIQKREGYRNQLDNITILSRDIVCVTLDNLYHRIDVAIRAMINDKDVDLKTGRVIRENESVPFVEYWTFVRRHNAKSSNNKGLIEGRCPNCGGELKITESGNCEYCKSFVIGGQYDWVLTEITQEEEYYTPYEQNENIPGLTEMTNKDPDFNIAVIEDKVSYIFFRMVKTNYYGDIRYIKGVCHPDYYNSLKSVFDPQKEWYQSLIDPAVGAVEVKKIGLNERDGFDTIDVMVRWSASYCERNRKTYQTKNPQERSLRTQVYTLIRRSNVKTRGNYNFKIIPCKSCGAPLGTNVEDRCEYCGSIINDGSRDWVLYSVDIYRPYYYSADHRGINKQNNESRVMLSAMIAGMLSDGTIDKSEKDMIYQAAQNRGVSKQTVDQMIESAKRGELVANPSNQEEARGMISSMARVALSDGKISSIEYKLLLNFGAKYNYQKADIDAIINTQHRLLFQQAKDFIKNKHV